MDSKQYGNGVLNGSDLKKLGLREPATDAPLVGVIGAGVAGLTAAQVLLEKGYNVAIFEARDRIGGRVCTSSHLGKAVDLGPNWIHGTSENPIIPLSELAESSLKSFEEACPVIGPDGEMLPQIEADKLQHSLWQLVDQATEYSKKHKAVIPSDRSLYDYGAEKAEEMYGSREAATQKPESGRIRWKGQEQSKQLFLAMLHMWGSFIGSSVTKQSLKYFLLEEPVEGPNLFVGSTYKPMVDILAVPAQRAGVINLSTPITSVTVTNPPFSEQRRILLTSPDATFSVDSVIVTIPLGCLKRSAVTFNPPLPKRMLQSISSLGYGHLEKVYINFPRAYWMVGDEAPGFYTFLAPTYAPETNPNKWHMCCFSLAHLSEPYNQPTLLFYIFGDTSAHLTSTFAAADTEEGIKQYVDFFEPYFSRINGYKADSPDCKPARILATNWSNDEYAGFGSYTNFQVGLEDGERDIEVFQEGIEDRGIWFAGEHTAPVLGLGSVSGAYWSGEDAAQKVVKSYGGTTRGGVVEVESQAAGLNGVYVNGNASGKTVDGACA